MIGSQDPRGVDYIVDIFLNKEYTKENIYEGENIGYLGMIFNFSDNDTFSIDEIHGV